ncbi:metal-dependent hydrolase [Penicillium longicatenatum]|uniref:metal-dependent hydrolase n=1 Tax=Penicillium longicatenatum TaxID=1561947 RepID=UPI0025475F88|nr:metal-dependent hydrolase [Penicillium longicatenatum]KAJ5642873.1 metal-dependent hydrolase [Penicillium longicatenatum]
MIQLIALEEHYVSSAVIRAQKVDRYANFPPHISAKLKTLGESQLRDLDNGNVSVQVISHGPGIRPPALCGASNDVLASATRESSRTRGFAMLSMNNPATAAKELERCVRELTYVGALEDNHVNGEFYDNERFWPVFQKAEELDVPMYIHPSFPTEEHSRHYYGNYNGNNKKFGLALSAFGWEWHSETALSNLKLFASGFFDRFPKFKIVIGHMGEMIPFQLERIINTSEGWGLKRGMREVWTQNIWVTTSGMFAHPPFECLLRTMDISHVLYSVDYPFSSNETGLAFFEEVQRSGLLSKDDLQKFAYRNAEDLLGVKAASVL